MVGDLNHDCFVDIRDFAMMAGNWLSTSNARLFYSNLDINPNWITEGQWAFGQPTGNGGTEWGNPDPAAGYTGINVYGVNLNGDYDVTVGGPYILTAGPFDCSNFYDVQLRYAQWLNTDMPAFIESKIEISNDGSSWHIVWQHTGVSDITDSEWQIVEYNVAGTADYEATVYFRWSYNVLDDRVYPYSGWNIDDIEILGKPFLTD